MKLWSDKWLEKQAKMLGLKVGYVKLDEKKERSFYEELEKNRV
jgi:hypothetical protein